MKTEDWETPLSFRYSKEVKGSTIVIVNRMEICQGGPEAGKLTVNGELFCERERFGGPFLLNDTMILIPCFHSGIVSSGFRIVLINLKTKALNIISKQHPVILIDEWIEGCVWFFVSSERINSFREFVRHEEL